MLNVSVHLAAQNLKQEVRSKKTNWIKKDELRVDTCSNCHPFFTGRQRFAAAQGRIEKFNKKYGLKSGQ